MARGHEAAGESEWMLICRPRPQNHRQIETRIITVHDNPTGTNHVIGALPRGIHPETDTTSSSFLLSPMSTRFISPTQGGPECDSSALRITLKGIDL